MRNPNASNPTQQSIYIKLSLWEAAREIAHRQTMTRSAWIVSLIEREKNSQLGKKWRPETKP